MSMSSFVCRIKQYLQGRKRKSDEPSEGSTNFAKYRRVADELPILISTPLSNDFHSKSESIKDRIKNTQYIRKTMSESEKSSRQSAYFGAATGKTRLEFADIEFSDDEDELDWINRQQNNYQGGANIVANMRRPPPLAKLKPLTAPIPSLFPIRTHMVNGNTSDNQRQEIFKKPFSFKNKPSLHQQTKHNSIVAQTYNLDEMNNYRALLKRLLPNLYSPEEPNKSAATSTRKNSLLIADDFNVSSSTVLNTSHGDGLLQHQRIIPSSSMIRSIPVIDLSLEECDLEGKKKRTSLFTTIDASQYDIANEETVETPTVDAVNTLREKLQTNSKFRDDIVENVQRKYNDNSNQRKSLIAQERENLKELKKSTQQYEGTFERKLGDFMLKFDTIVLDEEEPEEEDSYPELTDEHQSAIKLTLYGGPSSEVIISKFNISITRNDLATLIGDNWLNDEVINFYMNLLIERSESRANEGLPRVYAMNTFFIPKLLASGHAGLKRWTRKVDIFTYDIIPVPVHVGRVHWCMAIIDLKNQSIRYYDSMGTPNKPVLDALEQYLKDESLDKRKKPFNTSGFTKEHMRECPRQMNGSDCGVFSCMFAEHESRDREIGFSQQHMPYFRQKMIYEIAQGRLLT
ncbi:sentrin-specific protease 1-like isoform X6 [Malaya genurostris]|uniref:sentrin-specific protease 1-like isoform X6 n=1 Tax=Malaya genurostris TaxID=325434 RepID=UPI0026F3B207|nr:sentrin-specific protease 1-like isoform X6 [Malaya genurostris]